MATGMSALPAEQKALVDANVDVNLMLNYIVLHSFAKWWKLYSSDDKDTLY